MIVRVPIREFDHLAIMNRIALYERGTRVINVLSVIIIGLCGAIMYQWSNVMLVMIPLAIWGIYLLDRLKQQIDCLIAEQQQAWQALMERCRYIVALWGDQDIEKIYHWLTANCANAVMAHGRLDDAQSTYVSFLSEDDLILFRLTFC